MAHELSLRKTEQAQFSASPCALCAPGSKSYWTHFSTSVSVLYSLSHTRYTRGQQLSLTVAVEGNNHFPQSAGCHFANAAPCAVGVGYSTPAAGLCICPCQTSLGLRQPMAVACQSPSEGTNSGDRGITISLLYFTVLFSTWLDFFFFFLRTNLILPFDAV